EPTGALDSRTGLEIMALFKKLNSNGATIIIVTHDNSIAEMCGRSIRIRDGRVSG
ncbi:MAG TPA: ABC transporter ATP-binding protein, partial [Spirochaetaceae bacterium]|nr:ABC transporter ATP-binding protein [Spirochaetaceae bacterium]